ncbi:MAG: hypothetical protein ACT4QC_16710 [Planctomycetaceae bacterium]
MRRLKNQPTVDTSCDALETLRRVACDPRTERPVGGAPKRRAVVADRRGSVLLVVIGLLLLLMLVGFSFFTFAAQEQSSAEYYADAAKKYDVTLDSNVLFDWALEQLIIGPNDVNTQSVLWPGRHSLVPNMLGMFAANANGVPVPFDRHPYNGYGVNVISGANGQPIVNPSYDGTTSANPEFLHFNYSWAARIPLAAPYPALANFNRLQLLTLFPSIDVGYTYPDINNAFLAHVSPIPGTLNPITGKPFDAVIPTFHRPQHLRLSTGVPHPLWYIDDTLAADANQVTTDTRARVLCPHPGHVSVIDGTTPRYLNPVAFPLGVTIGTHTILPFNFAIDGNAVLPAGEQGVWSGSGTAAALAAAPNLDYPVDADGDGIRDSVWVDLNFPPQTLPDGRTYVPLFAFHVVDADALINLNAAGNLAGFGGFNVPNPFLGVGDPWSGNNPSIARSNLGVSASEINPWWALTADATDINFLNPPCTPADPTAALQQYRGFFGRDNTNSAQFIMSRSELANMDLWFLLSGRPKYDVTLAGPNEVFTINDLVVGRHGERALLLTGAQQQLAAPNNPLNAAIFPRAGLTGADDDADMAWGINDTPYEPLLTGLTIPTHGHPLDNLGFGSSLHTISNGSGNVRAARLLADPLNPTGTGRYRQYSGYSLGSQYQSAFLGQGSLNAGTAWFPNAGGAMIDEADEVVTDRRYTQSFGQNDQIFGPDEMAGLHLTNNDYTANLLTSRLRQLMPFNFELNLQAQAIRRRFTTESWDRRQHGFAFCNYPAATPRGNWEFNADRDNDGRFEFPPVSTLSAPGTIDPQEPFRLEVRAGVGCELVNNSYPAAGTLESAFNQQLRLSINRLLTRPNPFAAMNVGNLPVLRQLTPHPATNPTALPLAATPIPGSFGGGLAPSAYNPAAGTAAQEYWARRDRQLMARDIYVMLYMLGGGNDNVNYATTANTITGVDPLDPALNMRTLYSDRQLREMAQFAVNMVDALDRDDVLTRFEYDRDLSNGWNVDDNPYTLSGLGSGPPETSMVAADRGEVWGVEAQQLTISEVLAFRQPQDLGGDNALTPYRDDQTDRAFTFAELRNVSSQPVNLANRAWRLRLYRPAGGPGSHRSVVFFRNMLNVANPTQVPAGGLYTIGSSARITGGVDTIPSGEARPADFRVDINGDALFDRIIPTAIAPLDSLVPPDAPPNGTANVQPSTNLDLVHEYGSGVFNPAINRFHLLDHGGASGLPLPPTPQVPTSDASTDQGGLYRQGTINEDLYFILERRAHTGRGAPVLLDAGQNNDNPWVEVDRFQMFVGASTVPTAVSFPLLGSDNQATVLTKLQGLLSSERRLMLSREYLANNNVPGPRMNSIGSSLNSREATVANPQAWQPHFDRDFASVMDLMTVPLYGPDSITARLLDNVNGRIVFESSATGTYEARLARAKFLRPTHPAAPSPANNNRWYRILELYEFPSRANRQAENAFGLDLRLPAKINLNGLRHPEVLYALLDDPFVFNLSLADTFEAGRDWWRQLLAARDGTDPQTNLVLPGSPASRPFRGLAHAAGMAAGAGAQGVPAIEQTLFRQLMLDNEDLNRNLALDPGEDADGNAGLTQTIPNNPPTRSPRTLFEARPLSEVNPAEANFVDPHTRNRLLAKVANNSTSRGNVFVVWITVGFFDSYRPFDLDPVTYPNPAVVQIGAELPAVDAPRRRGFFIVDRTMLENAYDATAGTYDFRKFVQYRKTIE